MPRLRNLIFACLCVFACMASASDINLAWDANPEPELLGYNIYWGQTSGNYPNSVDVGNVTQHTLTLSPGDYFIAVTAYDGTTLTESTFSNEVFFQGGGGGSSSGPLGQWLLDESGGSVAVDSSGNLNDGVVSGGVTFVPAQIGNGASFSGAAADKIDVGSAAIINDLPLKSFAAWIKRGGGISADQHISSKGWAIRIEKSGAPVGANRLRYTHLWSGSSGGSASWFGSVPLDQLDVWYHVVVEYDSSTTANKPRMWIDGVEDMGVTTNIAPDGTAGNDAAVSMLIGNSPSGTKPFFGVIDHVFLFGRALTIEEIQGLAAVPDPVPAAPQGWQLIAK